MTINRPKCLHATRDFQVHPSLDILSWAGLTLDWCCSWLGFEPCLLTWETGTKVECQKCKEFFFKFCATPWQASLISATTSSVLSSLKQIIFPSCCHVCVSKRNLSHYLSSYQLNWYTGNVFGSTFTFIVGWHIRKEQLVIKVKPAIMVTTGNLNKIAGRIN